MCPVHIDPDPYEFKLLFFNLKFTNSQVKSCHFIKVRSLSNFLYLVSKVVYYEL
jgi:hypothetical protein